MRKFLKYAAVFVLVCCVGLPAAVLLFIFGMAAFGVVIGVGAWIVGMMFTVLKLALVVLLPLAILWWLAKRVFSAERNY